MQRRLAGARGFRTVAVAIANLLRRLYPAEAGATTPGGIARFAAGDDGQSGAWAMGLTPVAYCGMCRPELRGEMPGMGRHVPTS